MDNFFSWERVWEYFPKILEKFPVTINIVLVSFLFGLLFGLVIAIIRINRIPVLNQLMGIYISFMRGTPILVQLFVVYYGMPVLLNYVFHIDMSDWSKIVYVYLAYGLNQAAFLAEIVRGSIYSVDISQREAGYSVGLSGSQTFVRIIIPQAFQVALPQLETSFMTLFRATALAYMLGVIDIMGKAKSIGVNTFHTIEGYVDAAIIFTITSILLEQLFTMLNDRLMHKNVKKSRGKGRFHYDRC